MDRIAELNNIATVLQVRLTDLFPNSYIKARVYAILGEHDVHVTYANGNSTAQWRSGIIENDPAYMHFAIYSNKRYGTAFINKMNTHRIMPFKFRKINGKTEAECAEKLLKWFEKNQTAILAQGITSGY